LVRGAFHQSRVLQTNFLNLLAVHYLKIQCLRLTRRRQRRQRIFPKLLRNLIRSGVPLHHRNPAFLQLALPLQAQQLVISRRPPHLLILELFALEVELDSSLEWINHPAVFGRDSRKGVLQAIGAISSQRAYTFRTPIESLWAERIDGIKKMSDRSREWREITNQQGLGDATVVVEES